MGLDQYAYAVKTEKEMDMDRVQVMIDVMDEGYTEMFCNWRKHPNLQGWMEHLWVSRPYEGKGSVFNGELVELEIEDLDRLEYDVTNNMLPRTEGFFFGSNADEDYYTHDLDFIGRARDLIKKSYRVFYSSWW